MKRLLSVLCITAILITLTACRTVPPISGSESTNNLAGATERIPSMFVTYRIGDSLHEITAWQGVASWGFEQENGTWGFLLQDSSHPLQMPGQLPIVDRSSDSSMLWDVELTFEIQPDSITARRWVVNDMDRFASVDADFSSYTDVFILDTSFIIRGSDNSYIYEVTAYWLQHDRESFATYAFYVTPSAPVQGPRSTPQLYVSLRTESLPIQHARAAQLSNSWNTIDQAGNLIDGFCASAHHPLDMWALDFCESFMPSERLDEITFHLADADGEIELQFSDNFPPRTVNVRWWNAEFATSVNGGGSNMDLWWEYESLEIIDNIIRISNDGKDYIYEVEAIWSQGRSFYTFRIDNMREQTD